MGDLLKRLAECEGFLWDSGNRRKNADAHGVRCEEAEEVFFSRPLYVLEDPAHSKSEPRFHAFGLTRDGRPLAVVFTIRGTLIRVISGRDQNRKELKHYGFER